MHCSGLRHERPTIGCSSKVGQTRFERYIRANESILSGIISAMRTDATRVCASITCSSIPSSPGACDGQELTDTCVAGKRRVTMPLLGLNLNARLRLAATRYIEYNTLRAAAAIRIQSDKQYSRCSILLRSGDACRRTTQPIEIG